MIDKVKEEVSIISLLLFSFEFILHFHNILQIYNFYL